MSNLIHNTDAEPIYNDDDMENVLAQLREAKKESELTYQLLWAVVQAAGGIVTVPTLPWTLGLPEGKLEIMDDRERKEMVLRVIEPDDNG